MQKTRPWKALLTVSALTFSACFVQAAGLGGGAPGAVLGQSLDYAVNVRLDPGEVMGPDCFSAEVSIGERQLPPGSIRVLVEPIGAELQRVRVLSSPRIDEPVVTVLLNALCGARSSRRYVVLADPPAAAAAVPVAAPNTAALAAPAYAAAVPETSSTQPAVDGFAASVPAPRTALPSQRGLAPAAVARQVGLRERGRASPIPRAQRRAEIRAAAAKRRTANASAAVRSAATPSVARRVNEAGPRLQLDAAASTVVSMASATAVDQALEAVALAAAAARQSASAASAAAERIAALERTVDQLRSESRSNRDLSTQLREQLARAESSGSLIWFVTGMALLLATLAAWLGLRLSSTRRSQNPAWTVASRQPRQSADAEGASGFEREPPTTKAPPTSPTPFAHSESITASSSGTRPRPSPAWPPPAPPEGGWEDSDLPPPEAVTAGVLDASSSASGVPRLRVVSSALAPASTSATDGPVVSSLSPLQVTMVLPPGSRPDETDHRDVSIDELLDLEQQAEFFVVLGQDDAAIDLLVEHLRHTGGGSPLPYLKLMEIHRRRDERNDYERTRARFNHRFNAYAPEWEVDLQSGRALEDYPGVVPRLQGVWPRPLDSMAELEALLFRKSRGELFDLPAYREVLFLYALARDLLDRESADTGHVDLLLPLSSGGGHGDFSSTSPAPFELGRDSQHGTADFGDRPTAPVDLDLTLESDRQASIFDPLEERPQTPRRR